MPLEEYTEIGTSIRMIGRGRAPVRQVADSRAGDVRTQRIRPETLMEWVFLPEGYWGRARAKDCAGVCVLVIVARFRSSAAGTM